jgi:hypothetical protein
MHIPLETIALAGGLFVPLAIWHFVADWLTQSEYTAEVKHEGNLELTVHCFVYTVFFIPFLFLYGLPLWAGIVAGSILFWSHWIGDRGIPVWLWARYIRRMTYVPSYEIQKRERMTVPKDLFRDGQFLNVSFYFRPVLVIVVDQLWHLLWLWSIVGLALCARG